MAGGGFARLQRRIEKIEANAWVKTRDNSETPLPEREGLGERHHPPLTGEVTKLARAAPSLSPRRAKTVLPFAISNLDCVLAGGLRRTALHEMRCAESRDTAAMTGFAVAVLSRLAVEDDRPILWIVEAAAMSEAGFPYGAGLDRFGLDIRRLIVVRVAKAADALWVFEEGLRCRGLAAVLTEIRGHPRLLDLTASRRLALRAREHGVMGLLLRQSDRVLPGAANTRWLVTPQPATASPEYPAGIGHPAWRLTLERNRQGATGVFNVEWNHDKRSFASLAETFREAGPPLPRPVSPLSRDRPAASSDMGKIVALAVSSRPGERREPSAREEKRRRAWARG